MAVFDELKSIAQVLQEAGKIEQYRQILDVLKELLEMQKRIQEIEIENVDLKEKLKTRGDIYHKQSAYWVKKKDGTEDGPFCTRCWDKDKDLIRLNNLGDADECPECKNLYRFGRGSDESFPNSVSMNTW